MLLPTPGHREAWHQGRRWYFVTVLEVDDANVVARRNSILDAITDVCAPFSHATPHVTVFVHGFERPHPTGPTEVPLVVGGAGAFQTCVFLQVRCRQLAVLRAALGAEEHRWAHYLPHLTVGRFVKAAVPRQIGARLRIFTRLPPLLATGRLRLMAVDALRDDGVLIGAEEVQER